MFKKIAHNSTIPALGGNTELRPLQDLITAEKAVLTLLQKLSVDYSKAAEALRVWGTSEGDDLGDILSASTTLLSHFSTALAHYSTHAHTLIRDNLKAIRTREESLEDLKRRRRTVHRKADDAEKKLGKMGSEHKHLQMQNELLNRLNGEIRAMDGEIMSEETGLGDFKRSTVRVVMGLKFGGLVECCEKGVIVGEYGKLVTAEIPEETTQPGAPRSLYYGHAKTESLLVEATRALSDVQLSTVPGSLTQPRHRFDAKLPSLPTDDADDVGSNSNVWAPEDSSSYVPPIMTTTGNGASFFSQSQPSSPFSHAPPRQGTVDDFGILPARSSIDTGGGGGGGKFATFPVKTRDGGVGYTLRDDPISPSSMSRSLNNTTTTEPPSLNTNTRHELGVSFSMSVAEALGSGGGGVDEQPWGRTMSEGEPTSAAAIQPLPPGAAPASVPEGVNPWSLGVGGQTLSPSGTQAQAHVGKQGRHVSNHSIVSDDDDALLAYMLNADADADGDDGGGRDRRPLSGGGGLNANTSGGAAGAIAAPITITTQDEGGERERGQSRHVRFGGGTGHASELGEAEEWRRSLEERRSDSRVSPPQIRQGEVEHDQERGLPAETTTMALPNKTDASTSLNQGKRIPPPAASSQETQEKEGGGEDERALNAAVAREISREMDQLTFNPPSASVASTLDPDSERERGRPPFLGGGNQQQPSREPSPLLPPSAPFAKRAVSPHPFADLNPGAGGGGGYSQTPAQSYAQSYQAQQPQQQQYASYTQQAPTSPAQAYAQAYQTQAPPQNSSSSSSPSSTAQYTTSNPFDNPHAHDNNNTLAYPSRTNSNLPPRLQALSQQSQQQPSQSGDAPVVVPPRFQSSRSNSPVPPRFQQVPSSGEHPSSPLSDASYRTPGEYPRTLGSTPSLVGGAAAGGARTISAAAFKRPIPHKSTSYDSLGAGGTAPLSVSMKKPLPLPAPASLYPAQQRGHQREVSADDEYDYIGAYMGSDSGSPVVAEYGAGGGGGGRGGQGGYGEGKFATDLEGLR